MSKRHRFRFLVERHKNTTFAAALRISRDHNESQDIVQEAFLELFRRLDSLGDDHVGPWLIRVATNRALDKLRKKGRRASLSSDIQQFAKAPRSIDELSNEERKSELLRALSLLSERQREVVTLRLCQDQSFATIARQLDIAEGSVKVHFRRGITALRHSIDKGRVGLERDLS